MDPVFPITLPGPVLALTLRDWRFPECGTGEYEEKRNAYLHSFVEVCRYVHQTLKGSVVVFAQVRGPGPEEDDRIISGQFYKRLGPLIPETHRQMLDIPECVSPASIPEIFTHIDVLLGTRFHSVVSALIASTPAIAVSYQPKSRGIMKAMGIQEYCLDIGELTSQALIQRLDAVLQNYPSLVAKIKSEVSVARKQIEAAFSKIPLLVPPHDQNENTAGK